MKFLSAKDILNLRFLSKRFYNITLFDKKMKYFRDNSHNLFEVDDYYNSFFDMINNFLNNFKKKVDEVTFLFLKYSLEELKNIFVISNILYHLFSCPRSFLLKVIAIIVHEFLFQNLFDLLILTILLLNFQTTEKQFYLTIVYLF